MRGYGARRLPPTTEGRSLSRKACVAEIQGAILCRAFWPNISLGYLTHPDLIQTPVKLKDCIMCMKEKNRFVCSSVRQENATMVAQGKGDYKGTPR